MDCSLPGSSVHGTFRQEYRSGLPCPSLGNIPNPGIKSMSLPSPMLAGRFFTTSTTWEARQRDYIPQFTRVSLYSNMTDKLIKRDIWTDTHTYTHTGRTPCEYEGRDLQTKQCQRRTTTHLKLEKDMEQTFPYSP